MKKGFTLVEIIAILVLLTIIMVVSLPALSSTLKNSEEKQYEMFLKDLYMATETYVEMYENNYGLKSPDDFAFIELQELVNNGYIKSDIIDPKTKQPIVLTNTVFVKVSNDLKKTYEFTKGNSGLKNYTSDNLKIHYDGYNRLKSENGKIIWEDLKKTCDGQIINGNGIIDWQGNKIKLEKIDNYILSANSSQLITPYSDVTIEIVYESLGKVGEEILRNKGLGLFYLDIYKDGTIRSMVRNAASTANEWPTSTNNINMTNIGNIHTLAVTVTKQDEAFSFQYYADGVKTSTLNNIGSKNGNSDFIIGQDYQTGLNTNVYIYGVRIYSRSLTDGEINKNYNTDQARYGWER